MKLWEILKEENIGKVYREISHNNIWEVVNEGDYFYLKNDLGTDITSFYNSYGIVTLEFEEYEKDIKWNEIPIDTKILVKKDIKDEWHKRHFKNYSSGVVYCWEDGKTSFTTDKYEYWNIYKFYKEGDK